MAESEPIRPSTLRDSELPALQRGPVAPETKRGRRVALSVALVLAFLAVAWVASSLWIGITLGATLAFTTQTWFRRLVARFHDRHRSAAAAIVTVASGFVALVVGAFALYILGRELVEIVGVLQTKLGNGGSVTDVLGPRAAHLLDKMHVDKGQVNTQLHDALSQLAVKVTAAAALVLQTTGGASLTLIIALVTEYYVLLEWRQLALRLECVLPLDPRHTRALFLELRDVGRSAFIGTVATAIIQGTLAGIGFAIAGVPQPVTWGLTTAIASLLPVVGTLIVWIPIGAWQIANGNLAWGIFTLAWGLIITSLLSDYVIRPRLVGKKGHAHPLLMLIALLGGIEVMGLGGLIVAPILMSLFLAVLRIYERETCKDDPKQLVAEGH